MKEIFPTEFSLKMREISKETNELVSNDSKKSVIIISTEELEDGTHILISVQGTGRMMSRGIAEFATKEETRPIFELACHVIKDNIKEIMVSDLVKLLSGGDNQE